MRPRIRSGCRTTWTPIRFFGSAVALLDRSGTVITSPYVYRTAEGYAVKDIAVPTYNIEAQEWFTAPLDTEESIWTPPTLTRAAVRYG